MPKKILVVYFSQTGRVKDGLSAFLLPLKEKGHEVTEVALEPVTPLPFPWGFFKFFSILPETVLGPSEPIRPIQLDSQNWDLVVLGFPIWFLSIAQPMQTFLKEYGKTWLSGKIVLPFISCRELWWAGYLDLQNVLSHLGAKQLPPIVIKEPLSSWKTYLQTPLFFITGKKIFKDSYAEVFESLSQNALKIAENTGEWRGAHQTFANVQMEQFGKWSFKKWASLFKRFAPPSSARRNVAICLFFLYLLVVIPSLKLVGILVPKRS